MMDLSTGSKPNTIKEALLFSLAVNAICFSLLVILARRREVIDS
jgi:hypothetical protein